MAAKPKTDFSSKLDAVVAQLTGTASGQRQTFRLFSPPDVEIVARRMELDGKGRARGSEGLPLADATAPDEVEQAIARYINDEATEAHSNFTHALRVASENHSAGSHDLGEQTSISSLVLAAGTRLTVEANRYAMEMSAPLDRLHASQRRYRIFTAKAGLDRPCKHPSTARVLLTFGSMALMLLVELAFSGSLFARGSEQGFIGGIVEASLFSLLNIVLGIWLGTGSRYLIHYSWPIKLWGMLSLLALPAELMVLMFAGQLRSMFEASEGQVLLSAVWERLNNGHWLPDESLSLTLSGLGFLFFLFSTLEMRWLWDAYPGFSRVDQDLKDDREAVRILAHEAVYALEQVVNDTEAQLQRAVRDLESKSLQRAAAVALLEFNQRDYSAYRISLEEAGARLVNIYREANIHARPADRPAPAYFKTPVAFNIPDTGMLATLSASRSFNPEERTQEISGSMLKLRESLDYHSRRFLTLLADSIELGPPSVSVSEHSASTATIADTLNE